MPLLNLFITIALLTGISSKAQNCNYVRLSNEKGRKEVFVIKDSPAVSLVNGFLNISLFSTEMVNFQINQVSEKLLKDTSLTDKGIDLVLINRQKDNTYKSNSSIAPVGLKIKCKGKEQGTHFLICVQGRVYDNEHYYKIKARIGGKIPPAQFLRTY